MTENAPTTASEPVKEKEWPSVAYMREYNFEMLKRRIFGAFWEAAVLRKNEGSGREAMGEAMGRTADDVTRLFKAPRDWRLSTISDLAGALNLDIEFALVDRTNRTRVFLDTGMSTRSAIPILSEPEHTDA